MTHRFDIARYAAQLPPERRDSFAMFAMRSPVDIVRRAIAERR